MLYYEIKNRIGVLQNPQAFDLSVKRPLQLHFDRECIVTFDGQNYDTESLIATIPKSILSKGTKQISITVVTNGAIEKVYPCQPIKIYDVNDQKQCSLATSVDLISIFPKMSTDLARCLVENEDLKNKNSICQKNCKILTDKLNELTRAINALSERVSDLEKNYDPTLI